jgi:hypothetical protein
MAGGEEMVNNPYLRAGLLMAFEKASETLPGLDDKRVEMPMGEQGSFHIDTPLAKKYYKAISEVLDELASGETPTEHQDRLIYIQNMMVLTCGVPLYAQARTYIDPETKQRVPHMEGPIDIYTLPHPYAQKVRCTLANEQALAGDPLLRALAYNVVNFGTRTVEGLTQTIEGFRKHAMYRKKTGFPSTAPYYFALLEVIETTGDGLPTAERKIAQQQALIKLHNSLTLTSRRPIGEKHYIDPTSHKMVNVHPAGKKDIYAPEARPPETPGPEM